MTKSNDAHIEGYVSPGFETVREAFAENPRDVALREAAYSAIRMAGLVQKNASVGAVYDRALFLESTKYARSQTAPTVRRRPHNEPFPPARSC